MKASFSQMIEQVDFSVWRDYPALVFVLLGFVLTTIIQSSSATVAITLSALHVNAIGLYSATAVVLGSEVGTTIKLLLASLHGMPAKKRVALGNFMYNGALIIVVLITLQPINYLITDILSFSNPLLSLVFFQTFINVLGIIAFFPFLKYFEHFLQQRFKDDEVGSHYIRLVSPHEGDLALDAMDKEIKRFIGCTVDLQLHAFDIRDKRIHPAELDAFHNKGFSEKYDYLKLLHGEIHGYYIAMNKDVLDSDERERVEQLISAVRNSMFSAKSIKDSFADIEQLRNSSNPTKFAVYRQTQHEVMEFCSLVMKCLSHQQPSSLYEEVVTLYNRVQQGYQSELNKLYQQESNHQLTEVDISTLINFNREFFASNKALVWAVKEYLLKKEGADYFDELPGFIR
jgi:phosphate:Na+ symporter